MQVFVCLYFGYSSPFQSRLFNRIELFNEVCITFVSYHLFYFTDFCDDGKYQYYIGFSMIALVLLNVLINTSTLVVITILNFKNMVQRCWRKRKEKKVQKYCETQQNFFTIPQINVNTVPS